MHSENDVQPLASPLRMLLSTVVLLVLIGVGYVVLYGWPEPGETDEGQTAEAAESDGDIRAPAATPVPVVTAKAVRTDLVMSISATGNAEATRTLEVMSNAGGTLVDVPVAEGDIIQEGDLIAAVDDVDLQLTVESQREAYVGALGRFTQNLSFLELDNQSETAGELRDALVDSPRQLLSESMSIEAFRSLIDDPRFDELFGSISRDEIMAAQDSLLSNWANYRRAELELARARTVAPFGGQISEIEVVAGQRIAQNAKLVTLVDADPIRVRVEVLESQAGLVRTGRRAEVRFAAFPGEVFTGRVDTISPVVDPDQRTLEVLVALPNPDLRLKPGMFAEITLDTEIFGDRLLVPAAAVLLRDERPMVFIVENDRSQWSYIQKGLENSEWVEVLDGVEAGDEVIVSGHYSLAHDAAVRVVEEADGGDPPAGR